MIWRGPMVKSLTIILRQVEWGELRYSSLIFRPARVTPR